MKKGKRWLALLLSALLITGSVTGPVFASETDIADRTAEEAEVSIEDIVPEEDASVDEMVQEDSFGDVVLEEDSAFGEDGESVQEEAVLSEEPAEAESAEEVPMQDEEPEETDAVVEAPATAGDSVQDEEPEETDAVVEAPTSAEDSAQDEEPEDTGAAVEAPVSADDPAREEEFEGSAQEEEFEDSTQDGELEDSVLPEEPAESALPDQIVEESETQEEEVSEQAQQSEIQIDFDEEKHTFAPDEDLPSQDELFSGFVNSEFGISSGNRKLRKSSMGSRLTGIESVMYDHVSSILPQIAEGNRSSTVFEVPVEELGLGQTSWTAEELGVDAIFVDGSVSQDAINAARAKFDNDDESVVRALLADNPYPLYWFDKAKGWTVGFPRLSVTSYFTEEIQLTGSLSYSFYVSQDYAGEEEYTVDTSTGASVIAAAQNASDIVSSYSGFNDYDKLRGYMETICDLASYNYDAADDPNTPYGNPWQMIWVFDGDPDTRVVCEGYSKAFQYLCDKTNFDYNNISCYSVSGTADDGNGEGPHMWNIVTMDDGRNYLVDVTNCDYGTIGQGGSLLLAGTDGSVQQGYAFTIDDYFHISYTYSQETIDLFTDGILSLSNQYYTERPQIKGDEIELSTYVYLYQGTPQQPDVHVWYNGTPLTWNRDYELEFLNNINVGEASVIVHGIGEYVGTVKIPFEIVKMWQNLKVDPEQLTVDLWNTTEIAVIGTYGDITASSNREEIAGVSLTTDIVPKTGYSGNAGSNGRPYILATVFPKSLGTATITFSAAETENYRAGTGSLTVEVVPGDLANSACKVTIDPVSIPYSGQAQEPAVSVTYRGETLTEGTDYEVSYSSNVNAGQAAVTITGKGNCTGTKTVPFTISKVSQTITAPDNLSLTYPNKGKITASGNKGTLSYTSSNTAVAAVDSSGNVTAKGAGTATITIKAAATTNYNAATKKITVTVARAAQSITTKAKVSSVAVGKTVAVTTTGAKGKVTYKTSDTGIATVNAATGVVTAKKVGTVKITATAALTAQYNAASKTVTIKVVPAATASLKAENLAKGIKVTWAKVTGANGYDIYRNSKKVKTITSGTTVTWTDTAANTNNTKYVYKVVAKASTGASTLSKSLTTYKVTAPTNRSAVNTATRKAVLTWTRNASANGYQVQYSLTSSFSGAKTVTITRNATLTTTVSSLTKGKTYYTRIRAYKTVGSTKYYSNWSAARSVKISK